MLLLGGCATSSSINWFSPQVKTTEAALYFSHNISGETHPCGCKNFPLGGLAQLAGLLAKLKREHPERSTIYIDSGDMLYPSSKLPAIYKDSFNYTAQSILEILSDLGLAFWVPGENDFAFYEDFNHFKMPPLLISNLNNQLEIKITKQNGFTLFFIGYLNPEVLPDTNPIKNNLLNFNQAYSKIKLKLEELGYEKKRIDHRLILVSHSGMDNDIELANSYPDTFDWIIGSHSQSFWRTPQEYAGNKIVQVLSKNHYLGEIVFHNLRGIKSDRYTLHEVHDQYITELVPNLYLNKINSIKKEVDRLQAMAINDPSNPQRSSSPSQKDGQSCIACHEKQFTFWQKTPHSLAYFTLLKNNEGNNPQCLACHTLAVTNPKKEFRVSSGYMKAALKILPKNTAIRDLGPKVIMAIHKSLNKIARPFFMHVQCLNCHTIPANHPSSSQSETITKIQRKASIENQCISCHTQEHSDRFYNTIQNQTILNNDELQKRYLEKSCPAQ